ncbi:hypothetical protein EDB92DRAFT_2110736 [Lactarius akahatsu]|uniref:Uncharacterized protein n=1 Tax=Lactarius akahatsu TaxID=416441 RepID=A0AAD4LRP9_9AGAM|nr:hypothetical protein EDB92DRAFT_2110736 [Lactarius akahatsu]
MEIILNYLSQAREPTQPPVACTSDDNDDDTGRDRGHSAPAPDPFARVTFRSIVRSSAAKGKKAKATPAKDTRAKDFSYDLALSEANYYAFLQTILEKHHLLQYKVTSQAVFPCKVQIPPSNKSDATDVVNFDEYEGLVTKIIKRRPTKAIIVFVDMRAVEKAFSKKSRNRPFLGSEDEDGDGLGGDQGDNTDADENLMGLSKIDYELARLRCMLEKKHATDHNGTYAYIDPTTGATVPLTPYMIKEWARAMYDGLATVSDPPQTTTFDQENCKSSLGSRNRASSSASTIGRGLSPEVSALSAVSDLFSSITTFMRPGHAVPTTPKPSDKLTSCALNSPPAIFNIPSKLERFLQAAESNGVPGVQSYHSSLLLKGYGPDIMHLIAVPDLVEVGVSPGDAIRLREYASKWWAQERQRVTKRSLSDITQVRAPLQTGSSSLAPISTPPNKRLRFEKRFYDGGGMTTYGCGIAKGTYDTVDYTWWVYSWELKEYDPLPPGKVPVFNDPGPPEPMVNGEGCDGAPPPPAPGLAQGI